MNEGIPGTAWAHDLPEAAMGLFFKASVSSLSSPLSKITNFFDPRLISLPASNLILSHSLKNFVSGFPTFSPSDFLDSCFFKRNAQGSYEGKDITWIMLSVIHQDRNAQFEYINTLATTCQKSRQPVISVDPKKKELVGDFKNNGAEWRPKNRPEEVRVHDFADKELGKVTPYGVYDITKNEGRLTVGTDHDTSDFAIDIILSWWKRMGFPLPPTRLDF